MTTPAFRDWVGRARNESVIAVLTARNINLPGKGNKRAGPCPCCGGEDRFAVDLEREVFNCRGCGGKGHGAISLVMFLDGVSFLQACEKLVGEPPPKDNGQRAPQRSAKARGRFVCSYSYGDEHGDEQFQVVRYAEPKSFSQRRPDPLHHGEWIGDLTGVRLVPYRLSEMIEGVANGYPVYWVEGEKDADNGAQLGLITTTTAMGRAGTGAWERGVYDEFFRDAHVVLVPDQDADPQKGQALARVIAKRLKPVAASIHMLNLPVKDLSDWIAGGGSREEFDAMPLDEVPQTNGHDHAAANGHDHEDWFAGEPAGQERKKPIEVALIFPFPIDEQGLPRRAWITPGLLMRRNLSILVAPPGMGKSLLTLQIALMLGLGEPWGGWHPRGSFKCLVINAEDDTDEMKRRLVAACRVMNIDHANLRDRVAIADTPGSIIVAKADSRTKTVIEQPIAKVLIKTVIDNQIDVLVVDPFAETFEGDENSNSELKWAAVLWRKIARETNCAVLLVHHTRKYAQGSAGDMDASRGGGALVGVARNVSTLFGMSEKEAKAFDVDLDKRHLYLRFDDAKANLSLVTFAAKWFEKKSLTLLNTGPNDEPGDEVGALLPWSPPDVFDRLNAPLARDILNAIEAGVLDEDGSRTGTPFTRTRQGGSKRWAGDVVIEILGGAEKCSDKDAQKLLDRWHANEVIKEVDRPIPNSKGKSRTGLTVNSSAMPGTLIYKTTLADAKIVDFNAYRKARKEDSDHD